MTIDDNEIHVVHRVVIVDDQPEIRLLLRARLRMLENVEVVGEASNGHEALIVCAALAPDVVVTDLEMPVMRGDEAIPRLRELTPGIRILLFTGTENIGDELLEGPAMPDAIVGKGGSLSEFIDVLLELSEMNPHDVLRVELDPIPLHLAVAAFDTWVGLNFRILEAISRHDELVMDQMAGATLEELHSLIGLYAHLGDNIQCAVRDKESEVVPVIHMLRATAASARRALLTFDRARLEAFYTAWNTEVPEDAQTTLDTLRDQLLAELPTSSADESEKVEDAPANESESPTEPNEAELAAVDRAAAAIDRAAAEESRSAASLDELTGAYMRGPGHVELTREIARARRTDTPLVLGFVDVVGLKAINDTKGHASGDDVLRDVTNAIREQLREYDLVVRNGGDEFICVMPGISKEDALVRVQKIHESLEQTPHSPEISVGLALLRPDDDLESLVDRADAEMYATRSST